MKYYSMTEFAKLTNCTRQNVHYAIQKGKIKATLVGNGWIIPEGELKNFRNEDKEGGSPTDA